MTDQLPHDLAAEQSAVGAAILSPAALAAVTAIVPADGWYRPAHEAILAAAQAVADRGQDVDPVLVAAELERRGELGRIGGAPYLHTLVETVPTAANAAHYAAIVAEKATLRRLIKVGTRLAQMGHQGADGAAVDDVLDRARAELDQAVAGRHTDTVERWPDLLARVIDSYTEPHDPGLPTPWPDIDDLIGGLAPGTLTVIGARPGVGKSVLAGNIAAVTAADGVPVLMHSLEMPRDELVHRLVAAEASVDYSTLRLHRLDQHDWTRVEHARAALAELRLTIDDRGTLGVPAIRARARDLARHGLGLIIVDYLQLVTGPDPKAIREQQVAAVSRALKLLARDLNVPVVALAQLNRGAAQRATARPRMEDLRESGGIEADADAILLLHRDPDPTSAGTLDIHVEKNRHGPPGHVQLQWSPRFARARSLAPI